jgi:hypothetical protein
MSTTVAAAEWIKRVADDERRRDSVRVKEVEVAAAKADLIRRNGRRLVDELRAAISRDADAFSGEFPGDLARATRGDAIEGASCGGGVADRMQVSAAGAS